MPKSKYNSRKIMVDGIVFDSKREAERYNFLMAQQAAGKISNLDLQVKYTLLDSQYGEVKGRMKCLERPIFYYADFVYVDNRTGKLVVEDVKGYKRGSAYALYSIKRKMMLNRYGIRIKEV